MGERLYWHEIANKPMNWSLRTRVVVSLSLSLLLLGAVSVISHGSLRRLLKAADLVEHTQEVLKTSEQLLTALTDVETAHRGYVIAGDPRYLKLLQAARETVPPTLQRLRALTADNPSQQRRLDVLDPLIGAKLAWAAELVRIRKEHGFSAALRTFESNQGAIIMDQIQLVLQELKNEESTLLASRLAQSHADARRTITTMSLMALCALLLALGGGLIINRGIHEREAAESASKESERRLAALLEAAPDPIIISDEGGRISLVNAQAEAVFGYAKQELLGQPVETLIPERFRSVHVEHRADYARNPSRRMIGMERVLYARRKDSSEFPADIALSPLNTAQGVWVIAIVRDTTDRREKEAALRRANAQLESANKELEAFSYSVSHDLRAPLRSIDGFSAALLEDCADELSAENKDHLARVRAATQRMARLIDDMLDLSRVSRAEMHPARVDLSALAETALAELAQAEPERRVEVSVAPGLHAEGDERLLRLALTNLLGNAWKFTSKTPGARVEFSSFLQPDGTPAFYVRDNGAGFDPAYAHKLFGAFQRLHTESEFPGTGVGLATVQRVVHRHGGRVWAESAVGKGATFYFTIPNTPGRTA